MPYGERMTTQADAPDKTAARAPRQRRHRGATAKQLTEFQARAQIWLLGRPGKMVRLPDELLTIAAAIGIPCRTCGKLIYRAGAGAEHHSIDWSPAPGQHWAASITASCA